MLLLQWQDYLEVTARLYCGTSFSAVVIDGQVVSLNSTTDVTCARYCAR